MYKFYVPILPIWNFVKIIKMYKIVTKNVNVINYNKF